MAARVRRALSGVVAFYAFFKVIRNTRIQTSVFATHDINGPRGHAFIIEKTPAVSKRFAYAKASCGRHTSQNLSLWTKSTCSFSEVWRRGRDLNPRYLFGVYRISSPARSTTLPPLHARLGELRLRYGSEPHLHLPLAGCASPRRTWGPLRNASTYARCLRFARSARKRNHARTGQKRERILSFDGSLVNLNLRICAVCLWIL